jgi:hypothetical protein
MQECRNCGSANLMELGFVGEVAPFFLKRVLNMEVRTSLARHPLRLLARRLGALPQRLFAKVYGSSVFMEMQICLHCSFVQAKHSFSEDALGRLYGDYRSPTYDLERIHYEPTYAAIAKHIGVGHQELETRVAGLTAWLSNQMQLGANASLLDFGGSDGRFLPRFEGKKFLFDISDLPPWPGVVKVAKEVDLGTYSYVQISHVLEHVAEPLSLLKHVASFCEPSGYLYIEVPQEITDDEIEALKTGKSRRGLTIHEHINVYCSSSIARLVESAGLELVKLERTSIDFVWTSGTCIRALCKKPA